MKYRKADKSEIEELVKLRKIQLIDEGLNPDINIDNELKSFFETTLNDGSLIEYVVTEDNKIIATGAVYFYKLPPSYSNPSGKVAYITNMYTKEEYRGKGIATNLLKLLLDEAKEKGCSSIRLQASIYGKSVYKKFGFEESEGHMIIKI